MSTPRTAAADDEHSVPAIRTVAGTGEAGFKGEKEPAASATLNRPYGVAVDNTGTLYISDSDNHRVRKVTTDGKISTFAGTGVPGSDGDGGPAVAAQLNSPHGLAANSAGDLFVADAENHRIRKITADGKISTIAGTGTAEFSGDDGPATAAELNYPHGVVVDSAGTLYVSDSDNHRVRKITTDGKISTFAGTGVPGSDGDGGPAVAAQLNSPHGLTVNSAGDLFVADAENHRIRKVTPDGSISTFAGTGTAGSVEDGGSAASAQLHLPLGVVVDSTGTLYVSDHNNHRVRKIALDGKISTFAGTGTEGSGGDDGPATAAELNYPLGLAVNCVDALYIADYVNNRVRKIASAEMAGLPASGTVVSWANVRSRLRMAVVRESVKDGAEIQQSLAAPRAHQRWRLVVAGQDNGDILYTIENVRSGKVLEVVGAQERSGSTVAQRDCEGADAGHQQWRLIPVGSVTDTPRVYEIANQNSGLLLRVDTNARTVIQQHGSDGDHRSRQWQLLPV
ncbi:RICIN domain-containing protein [Streptomyces sp. NPDC006285]|uniref:NHL domain-containing protein n=1 Tax=Streptomyces sp. NPDC006285 TaxID=3364742 RepID=UPI0036C07BFC